MTKEEFGALVKSLDSLGLGTNDRDTIHRLQPTQGGALLTSVFLAPSVEFHTEFSPVL